MPSSLTRSLETETVVHRAKHGLGATSRTAKTAMLNAVFIGGFLFGVGRAELRHSRSSAVQILLTLGKSALPFFSAERWPTSAEGQNAPNNQQHCTRTNFRTTKN